MNQSELIQAIADDNGLSKSDVEKVVKGFVDVVTKEVARGESVTLSGFGSFEARDNAAREGRNPATGETIQIAASRSPKFKPGSKFKAAVKG